MLLYDEKSFKPRRFYSFAAYNAKEKKIGNNLSLEKHFGEAIRIGANEVK